MCFSLVLFGISIFVPLHKNEVNKLDTFDRIEELLKKNDTTAYKMAKATGISTGLISQWKKRSQQPSGKKLALVADYFGVSVDYLLGKENIPDSAVFYDEDDNVVTFDKEVYDILDTIRKRPDMRLLFSVSKKATKEDILKAIKIIEALKDGE